MSAKSCVFVFALFTAILSVISYKHVILMHGILAKDTELLNLQGFIEQAHPGTNVTIIDKFLGRHSLHEMWGQIDVIKDIMSAIFTQHREGVHLICFSQGGLICRGVLSLVRHNVDTFVSLSSPLAGQYGDTDYLKHFFPNFIKENIYRYFYTKSGQSWSIANYWNDPHQQQLYLKESVFLAVLNNQSYNPYSFEYKENFSRIKSLVLIGGPDDGVITPWQSSHFAFFDQTAKRVVEMRQQEWYLADWFGLRTLDQRNAIHTYSVSGVQHILWHSNRTVFSKYILPWLS